MIRMTLALAVIAATLAMASAAPSVVAIEHAFHLYPGAVFPIILPTGEHLQVKYLRAEVRSAGEYAIIVKLER